MTYDEGMAMQLLLARVQISVTILLSLGSTLFAVGIGFGVTIPPTLQQIISEGVTSEGQLELQMLQVLSDYAFNYSLILVGVGLALIIAGVAVGIGNLARIRKKMILDEDE